MSDPTPRITVVGLGPGDPGLLTQQTLQLLRDGTVILRTRHHPTIETMAGSQDWPSFDYLYESNRTFEGVNAAIVAELMKAATSAPIVYAVPGHPLFGDATVQHLIAAAAESRVTIRIVPAISFLDSVSTTLRIDPIHEDLQLVDALDVAAVSEARPYSGGLLPISPLRPAVIAQVSSDRIASAVKLALSQVYPDDIDVTLITVTRTGSDSVSTFPLFELNRQTVDHLSSLYIPAVDPLDVNKVGEGLQRIVARLRAPGGCPWDREQTHDSLTRHMLEEAYEAIDAIERDSATDLKEELGDVLLQVFLHAQIAEESAEFTLEDIIETLSRKLVRRHPHVFGDRQISTSRDVVKAWDQIKQEERSGESEKAQSPFASIPISMPALARAQTVLRRAGSLGISIGIEGALQTADSAGDFELAQRLASVVSEADAAGIDIEQALRRWTSALIERSENALRSQNR